MGAKSFSFLIGWCACAAAATGPLLKDGVDALQRGDFASAERILRSEIQAHPDDVEGLSFLGAALDNQKKFAEADTFHRRALTLAPKSSSILDNYGSHLATTGDDAGARRIFLQSLALNPADGYANLELAQLALKSKDGPAALHYLDHLSAEQARQPQVALRRVVALALSARNTEATALAAEYRQDPAWSAAAGRALADAGQLNTAESLLESALAANPAAFPVLFSLGVVASHTGHYARARELLEAAQLQQPRNADVLFTLAYVCDATRQTADAFRFLTQATKIAPERADIQKSLALAASNLGEYKAAADAWDACMKLDPSDDSARRERGFARVHLGQFDAGIADLKWYVAKYPRDAEAWYELGVAESSQDPSAGMASFDKALAFKPDFPEALSDRGALYYREGRPESALPDLERAAAGKPDSAIIQYRLGQTYLALERLNDALIHFRRAAELAPDDYVTQFHFANALAEAGQTAESEAIMARIRKWPVRETTPLTPTPRN